MPSQRLRVFALPPLALPLAALPLVVLALLGSRCEGAECKDNDDCGGSAFCCQGTCLADTAGEVSRHCGCAASPEGRAGTSCEEAGEGLLTNSLCLVDGALAGRATVADGTCGCSCTSATGGPLCTAPEEPGLPPTCSCDENADCRGASLDAQLRPHRSADTCTPSSACVCFSLGTALVCDPDGARPDCASAGGCFDLASDVDNCGVPARACAVAATGIEGTGACRAGGCTCDAALDCQGTDLNVNTCAFLPNVEGAQCVCSGYTAQGAQAACPMELPCSAAGCLLNGTAYPSQEELNEALGFARPAGDASPP